MNGLALSVIACAMPPCPLLALSCHLPRPGESFKVRGFGIPQGLLLSPEALKSVCGESVQLLFLAALLDDQSHSTSGHNGQHQHVRSIVEDDAGVNIHSGLIDKLNTVVCRCILCNRDGTICIGRDGNHILAVHHFTCIVALSSSCCTNLSDFPLNIFRQICDCCRTIILQPNMSLTTNCNSCLLYTSDAADD